MEDNSKLLRLATYMCPSIPVEYYEFLAQYLERVLGLTCVLIYDSKRPGPDTSRGDDQRVDIAFVTTSSYLDKYKNGCQKFKLFPVSAVTKHPVKGEVHGYYTDVVVHRDVKERIKDFLDIRGCKYVYASEQSISSARQVLLTLKQMGENASFFSDVQAAGDHMTSLETVVSKRAEATAVDSLSLTNYLNRHYYQESEVHLQQSFGPLPPHPILVNANMPAELCKQIEDALLRLHQSPEWSKQLVGFGVVRFAKTSTEKYYDAIELLDNTKNLSLGVTYY